MMDDPLDFATKFLSIEVPSKVNNANVRGWYERDGQNMVQEDEEMGQDLSRVPLTTNRERKKVWKEVWLKANSRGVEGTETTGIGRRPRMFLTGKEVSFKKIQAAIFDPGKEMKKGGDIKNSEMPDKVDVEPGGKWLKGDFHTFGGVLHPGFQDRAGGSEVKTNLDNVEKESEEIANIEESVGLSISRVAVTTAEEENIALDKESEEMADVDKIIGGEVESVDEEKIAFKKLVLELPLAVDRAREEIVNDIAERNRHGYTIAIGFFLSAIFESIAAVLVEEVSIHEPSTIETLFWTLVMWWSYYIGFAWSYLFPDIFGAGSSNLPCSGQVSRGNLVVMLKMVEY